MGRASPLGAQHRRAEIARDPVDRSTIAHVDPTSNRVAPPAAGGRAAAQKPRRAALLLLGALGVVFGDIGTSPLYAMQTLFSADHNAVLPTHDHVTGIISLVVWALVVVVTIKYVTFVLRADHNGEGGILSLATLLSRTFTTSKLPRAAAAVTLAGIVGSCFFFGDSVITPAISVMSAVEGLRVAVPALPDLVVPVAIGIVVVLFTVQRFGTARVGRVFGPVMVLWFVVIAALGVPHIVARPEVLIALLPLPGVRFLAAEPLIALVAMGAVVLVVTGAEALYADIGHFGRRPIQRAWLFVVLPALLVNYLGQGALILTRPEAVANPFFLLAPDWAMLPVTLLSILATIIASQSVITGSFSVAKQAMRLGYLPPMTVRRTSSLTPGQIYMPAVNWVLFAAVITVILAFRSSTSLASAYGLAVTTTFVITTILFVVFARRVWGWPRWTLVVAVAVLSVFELTFLVANLAKILNGGWLPALIGVVLLTIMTTWRRGRAVVGVKRRDAEGTLDDLLGRLRDEPPPRAPGTVVFPHASTRTAPLALRLNLALNGVLHERTLIARVATVDVPHVAPDRRVRVEDLEPHVPGIERVTIRFGFMDTHDVPAALRDGGPRLAVEAGDLADADYVLSRTRIVAPGGWSPRALRARLFVLLTRAATSPAQHYHLPLDRTVELRVRVTL